jgi:alpha-glucosidase (family GH31 glycosyl hydrolase)
MVKLVQGLMWVLLFISLPSLAYIKDIPEFRKKFGDEQRMLNFKQEGNVVNIETSGYPIRLEFLREDLVKIRYANAPTFAPEYTWSVDPKAKFPGVVPTVEDLENKMIIKTSKLKVRVTESPVLLTVLDANDKVLLETKDFFADLSQDDKNKSPEFKPATRMLLGAKFTMHDDEHFYGLGEKFRGFKDKDHKIMDLSLDWRGKRRDKPEDGYSDIANFGNTFEGADGGANGNVVIPFLISSRGYSLYFDTHYKTIWEFHNLDQKAWYLKQDCDMDWEVTLPGESQAQGLPKCEKAEMRFYVTVSTDPKTTFSRYTEITGKPLMPPRWMLGFLQSKYGYNNWAETHEVAEKFRKGGYPLDALFLDLQWFGGVPGVHEDGVENHTGEIDRRMGTLEWSTNPKFDFSEPLKNIKIHRKNGVEIVPIEEGYVDFATKNFQEGQNLGHFARKNFDSKEAAEHTMFVDYFGKVTMVNTCSKAAREWFWEKHLPALRIENEFGELEDGAATYWKDLGEPERKHWWWKYTNEDWGNLWHQDVHNAWDLNRAKMFYDGFTKDLPDRRPFFFSRSGSAGSQRYGVGIWAADTPARLEWMAAQPAAHLNLSMSGIPYTTSDIGGFGGYNVKEGNEEHVVVSSPAQYTRWLQMESFSSLTRAHGNVTFGEHKKRRVHPYEYTESVKLADGRDTTYAEINKKYMLLRESLIPYLYTFAFEAYETGMPIMRALPLIYPNDEKVADLSTEYLFGDSILVAPILSGSNNNPDVSRKIYFPKGTWIDLHNGDSFVGPTEIENFSAPIEKMPLFAKEGAIIPKALPTLTSLSDPAYETSRILELFPSNAETKFSLYDDSGKDNDYKSGKFAKTEVTLRSNANSTSVKVAAMNGEYKGMPEKRAYHLEVHSLKKPRDVVYNGASILSGNAALPDCGGIPVIRDANYACYFEPVKKIYIFAARENLSQEKIWEIKY